MDDKSETFRYTYSARQQEEIDAIRKKYLPEGEDKMKRLRRLDQSAAMPGTVAAITAGTAGVLLLGIGMCCTMVWAETMFVPGIIIGVIGIMGALAAYPLYTHITRKRREKLAPEILRLIEELTK